MTKKEKFEVALLEALRKKNVFAEKYRVKEVERMENLNFINHIPANLEDDSMECWETTWCKCSLYIKTEQDDKCEILGFYDIDDIDVKIVCYSCEKGFTVEILNTPILLRKR